MTKPPEIRDERSAADLYDYLIRNKKSEPQFYLPLSIAIEATRYIPDESTKEFLALVDLNNLRFLKSRNDALIRLGEAFEHEMQAMNRLFIEHALDFATGAQVQREGVLAVIDRLVRQKRVQFNPAERIKQAVKIFYSKQDNWREVEREIPKLHTWTEMTAAHVKVIETFHAAHPSGEQLAKSSGYSPSAWSKNLRKNATLLLQIRSSLEKKRNQAKTDPKRGLFLEAIKEIEHKMELFANQQLKRMSRDTRGDERVYITSDRFRRGEKFTDPYSNEPMDEFYAEMDRRIRPESRDDD